MILRILGLFAILTIPVAPLPGAERLVLVAGGGEGKDGQPATQAKVIAPFGVDFAENGAIYFVEMAGGERLRAILPDGTITTLAGTGSKGTSGDNGPATEATFNGMHSLAVGPEGIVYLADTWNNRVRTYVPAQRVIAPFAGTGKKAFSGDGGPAANAEFGGIYSVAFNPDRSVMVLADLDNRRIRAVSMKTGIVTTVAGNGKRGIPQDGELASEQPLVDPRAAAMDGQGNLYVLERSGHALRVVDTSGRITTVAGTGKAGSAGANGPALQTQLNGPKHLTIDTDGSVLLADTENHRILRYLPREGKMELVAGTGKKGTRGLDGDPKQAEFHQPHGVIRHPKTGEIYISDSSNNRILKILKQ